MHSLAGGSSIFYYILEARSMYYAKGFILGFEVGGAGENETGRKPHSFRARCVIRKNNIEIIMSE